MSDIDAQRAARRAAMPIVSAMLEEFAEFSPKVIFASENGISVGKRPVAESAFTIPPGYFPMRPVETKKK